MNQPMILWCAIAAVLLLAFLFRACVHHGLLRSKPIIEIGKEREIFYIPGDVEDDDSDVL